MFTAYQTQLLSRPVEFGLLPDEFSLQPHANDGFPYQSPKLCHPGTEFINNGFEEIITALIIQVLVFGISAIIYPLQFGVIGVFEVDTDGGMSKTGSSFDLIELISRIIRNTLINTFAFE